MANQAPDFGVILNNVAQIFPPIYFALAGLLLVMAIVLVFSALVDMAQVGDPNKKYFGTAQPSFAGALIKLMIAGVMASFAASGDLIAIISHGLFGVTQFELVSIDSYDAGQNEDAIRRGIRIVIISLTQCVGIIAIIKGLRVWAKCADKSGKESAMQGLGFIIAGVLCVQVALVVQIVEQTLGYKLTQLIGVGFGS